MEDVPPKINESLRDKVVAAARMLGYQADDAFVLKACQLQVHPHNLPIRLSLLLSTMLTWTKPPTGTARRPPLRDAPRPRRLRQDGHLEDAGRRAQP